MNYRAIYCGLTGVLLGITICQASSAATNAATVSDAIVKIYTVSSRPDYHNPWNAGNPGSATGSGCIIKGRKVLTNAHVVSDGTFIQVRRYGQSQRYNARVQSISHEADLALLSVDDPDFFTDVAALELGVLPAVQQEVSLYGYPMGGDTMCITRGVVSRVEHQMYVHSGLPFLAVQVDAPVNPGNSGGPAIVDGRIAGVAMMECEKANSIGYLVPAMVIQHFFDDLADGHQDGFPAMGISLQNMENPDLKRRYLVPPKQDGVLVTKIVRGSSAEGTLCEGDVITHLDDQPVAGDGTVELRKDERTSCSLIVQQHQIGDKLKVDYIRKGRAQRGFMTLTRRMADDLLVPLDRYDVAPTYYIFGGLVFCPLTTDLVKAWGENWVKDAPMDLLSAMSPNMKSDKIDEVVVLLTVLAGNLNQGYQDINCVIIRKVNGHDIRNLRDLITSVENTKELFVSFEDNLGEVIILDRQRCRSEQPDILKTYQIASDRSADLLPASQTVAGKSK